MRGAPSGPTSGADEWVENRPTHGRRALRLDELWSYRELVAFLALRDVKVRYKQAVFGGAWAVVQPLTGAAIFTVLFGRVAKLTSDGIPYFAFAFAGFSLWWYFATSVNNSRSSLVSNAALITKVYFPRMVAPLAGVLPGLLDLAVTLVVLGVVMAVMGLAPGIAIVTAPLFVAAAMVVAFAAGTLFAAVTVQYRDVEQVFGLVVQLWLLATPVGYSSSVVTGAWRWPYRLNPMVTVVDGWRWSLLGGPPLGPEALVSVAVTAVLLMVGVRVFLRCERRFADVI
ncbi:MAG: ABC transporter permease [Acidimicrobiales bacterium]